MKTTIEQTIQNKLREIEQTEDVRIILAVESGSRAWGFASPDSDYDVRFIYVRRPEDYIRLQPLRDVIEWQLDDVYDVNGWDLQKALRLLHDANPTLQEWCASPIVYCENALAEPLRALTRNCFQPKKALFHYLSMAKRTCAYLKDPDVRLKKYFYVLRPILAAEWIAEHHTAPPMLFSDLVEAELPDALKPIVAELLARKSETSELGTGPHIPELDTYIYDELVRIEAIAEQTEPRKCDWQPLEEFFKKAVQL